jgi:UDP-N-acetylglucosamine:LPS N-acetylglucosamine transferase
VKQQAYFYLACVSWWITTKGWRLMGVRRKVLAVASSGGHWIQLLRLNPAFRDIPVAYVTTDPDLKCMVGQSTFYVVSGANRHHKIRMFFLALQIAWVFLRERPTIVITTGAAPGYIAIRVGRFFGAKTVWVDSIANSDELSLSGRLASKYGDVVLTQWSHLAQPGCVEYRGAVI